MIQNIFSGFIINGQKKVLVENQSITYQYKLFEQVAIGIQANIYT